MLSHLIFLQPLEASAIVTPTPQIGNGGPERLGHLPNITQLGVGGARPHRASLGFPLSAYHRSPSPGNTEHWRGLWVSEISRLLKFYIFLFK